MPYFDPASLSQAEMGPVLEAEVLPGGGELGGWSGASDRWSPGPWWIERASCYEEEPWGSPPCERPVSSSDPAGGRSRSAYRAVRGPAKAGPSGGQEAGLMDLPSRAWIWSGSP